MAPESFEAQAEQLRAGVAQHMEAATSAQAHHMIDDNPIWRDHKAAFAAAQHHKCGFCERKVTGSFGDVEHYRPKNAVHTLLRRGTEVRDLNNVRGRSKLRSASFDQGYWWLAWSWHNYLLACDICNRAWKKSFFHIEGGHAQPPSPESAEKERPLLLHPWEGADPVEHLRYDEFGQIEPAQDSASGRCTIDICGLDRERLRDAREEKANQTFRACRVLIDALLTDAGDCKQAARDLSSLGRIDRESAGMVRSIALHGFGLSWPDVEALASWRPNSGTPAPPPLPG